MKSKKLTKSNKNKMICGVCSGIGQYFNIDPTIVRLIFVLICFFKGAGFLLYLITAIIMPSDMNEYDDDEVFHFKSANLDENSSNESGKNDAESEIHTDEEFNAFFKKDSK